MYKLTIQNDLYLTIQKAIDVHEYFILIEKNRQYLLPWMAWVPFVQTEEQAAEQLKNFSKELEQNFSVPLFIWYQDKLVGFVTLWNIHILNRSAQLGYWIDKEVQGKGIATMVCRAVVGFGFRVLQLHRIEIHCSTKNQRSQKIAKKLGFRKEGNFREAEWINEGFVNHYVFALLEHEWKEAQQIQYRIEQIEEGA